MAAKAFAPEKFLAFYEQYAVNTFARPGDADPCLVAPEHHLRRGFEVRRYEDGLHWFCESGTVWTPTSHAGNEVVYYRDEPVWIHQYQGFPVVHYQTPELLAELAAFYRKALRVRSGSFQPRGPESFEDGGWKYSCWVCGDFQEFSGNETIFHKTSDRVFNMNFMGGLIG